MRVIDLRRKIEVCNEFDNPVNVAESHFNDFGSVDNLPAALNSVVEIDNSRGNHSIGFLAIPPAGGEIVFESSFDGVTWTGATLRSTEDDGYTKRTSLTAHFIGSISTARKFRVRVSLAGSAPGSIIGRMSDHVNTIEGIEHGYAPHNIGYSFKRVSFEFLNPQTDADILVPTPGKAWVLVDLIFSVDGVNNITIFDHINAPGNEIIVVRSGNERFFSHAFRGVVVSNAVDNVLRVTSSNQADFRGTAVYYEID